jgi:hypothetical protein
MPRAASRPRPQLLPLQLQSCKDHPTDSLIWLICCSILAIAAAIVLFFLHRRNVRKEKEEDAKDKYKSMDFGLEEPGKKKKGPEMRVVGAEPGHAKGMSLDVGHNPYILPPGLHSSRDSFHSLSRTITDSHDPYRPVTFVKSDAASVRSSNRGGPYQHDNASMHTTSSSGTDKEKLSSGLLNNAQRMSQSMPLRAESMSPPQDRNMPEIRFPEPTAAPTHVLHSNATLPSVQRSTSPPSEPKNDYAAFKPSAESHVPGVQQSKSPVKTAPRPPARIESQQGVLQNANTASFMSDSSYGEGFKITPPSPTRQHQRRISEEAAPLAPQPRRQPPVGLGVDEFGGNQNRLSMSLRPLPPDDPTDNPEQRANRIRSFYKEYFDDSKPEPAGDHAYNDYVEDYGSEYLDGAMFDERSNAFVVAQPRAPYAQPVTRRAMTPPPRAPPRFRSGSNPRGPGWQSGTSSPISSPGFPPRGMSAMSGRLPPTKKPLPPPSALKSLPTPSKLTEEFLAINPADFAPPVSMRDLQNGRRPDSPLGSSRPYSPSVKPHTPLVGSFDDLMVMPSP